MHNLDFSKLLKLSYLLERRPTPQSELVFVLAAVFGLAIIASGVVWLILVRKERHDPILHILRDRFVRWLFTSGFVGLVIVFCRWQGIPYFASRLWLMAWLVVVVIWLVNILIYLLKSFPKERRLDQERRTREKYLPKGRLNSVWRKQK